MGFIGTRCDSCLWLRSYRCCRCCRCCRRLGAVGSHRRRTYLDAIRLFDGALQYFGFGWPPIHQRLQHILNTSCARRTRRPYPSRRHCRRGWPASTGGASAFCIEKNSSFGFSIRARRSSQVKSSQVKSSQVKSPASSSPRARRSAPMTCRL